MTGKRIENLKNLMTENSLDAVLITSRSNVYYLSGFSGSSGDLLITHDEAYIICDSRYTQQAGIQAGGFKVRDVKDGIYAVLNKLISYHRIMRIGIEDREITYAVYEGMRRALDTSLVPIGGMITKMREIKDVSELMLLEKAAGISVNAYETVLPMIKPGVRENEIAAEIEYIMRKNGASGASFETIVASGENSSKPHGVAGMRKIQNGDMVVIDFGCIYNGYCSDMTRTVAVGDISVPQKNAYNALLYTQLKMIDLIKSGMRCCEVDKISRNILKNLGYDKYFGHSLGHGVGIDIHELPNLSPKCDTVLKPGMVVTVEPGVYFDGFFGIRIEDTVEILKDGVKIITKTPKNLVICK